MPSRRWIAGIAFVVAVLAIVLGYRWWASDERAIRNRMEAIAESLTIAPNEGSLGPVTRIAGLRNALAPDIRVSAGASTAAGRGAGTRAPGEVVGRDAVLALVSRWIPPSGGVAVEFVDVQVSVGDSGADAQVYCTAMVTSRGASEQPPTVDARELTVDLARIEGEWLVSAVQVEETLMR